MKKKSILLIILLVILVILGIYFFGKNPGTDKKAVKSPYRSYLVKSLNINFDYPREYDLLERLNENDKTTPSVLTFSAGKDRIVFVPSIMTIAAAREEKISKDKNLFQDSASRLKNSQISIEGFEGYKSLVDFNHSQYLLYRQNTSTTTLKVEIEISSDSPENLMKLENTTRSILKTIH